MSTVESIKSLAARIKWRSVLAVILLIALVAVIYQSMPGGYSVASGVGIRVSADPTTVSPGGSSVVDVELKNVNEKGDVSVVVTAKTYDVNLYFDELQSQSYKSALINIGPQETRRISVKVASKKGILQGNYNIDFTATQDGNEKGASARLPLTVEKSE
jgi:hypothetical protein